MKLRELYYRIRYRTKNACAIAIINSDGKKKSEYDKKLDYVAGNTSPCYKENEEVLAYIKSKYELKQRELTDIELEMYKVNFLLGRHPELLKVHEQSEERFTEAKNYPIEKLGLDIKAYTFDYVLDDGFVVKYEVTLENTYDNISVGFSVINRTLSENEEKVLLLISDEIKIFKGVKKEDIENRTTDFMIYADAVMRRER